MNMDFGVSQRRELDPDYFSLRVRRALRVEEFPPEERENECFALVTDEGVVSPLASHPEAVEAAERVVDAESAVLAAEDAGVTDELAMRRLERARAAEDAVLRRLQKARIAAHTARSVSRTAQVIALRPSVAGGEVA